MPCFCLTKLVSEWLGCCYLSGTLCPSCTQSTNNHPTEIPTLAPVPTNSPTLISTVTPGSPTALPSIDPSAIPTAEPSTRPSPEPTEAPSSQHSLKLSNPRTNVLTRQSNLISYFWAHHRTILTTNSQPYKCANFRPNGKSDICIVQSSIYPLSVVSS